VRRAVSLVAIAGALLFSATVAGAGPITATVTPNPLEASLSLSAMQISVGGRATATADVRNLGIQPLPGAAVTLQLESTGIAVVGNATQQLGTIPAGGTASASWQVCGVAPGNYVLAAQAAAGDFTAASPARLLAVTQGSGSCDVEPSTPGCTAGAGTLSTNVRASFAFAAAYVSGQAGPTGLVGFKDTRANKTLVSIRLTSLVIAGTHVTIRGDGEVNRTRVSFRIDADDGSVQRKPDTFAIQWPGYSASGNVVRGDIGIGCDARQR
jgi:hypothetical protein